MRNDLTYIAVVLDRSGSMADCKRQTIDGFNEFLNKQQLAAGEAKLYLAQFDDQYDLVYDKSVKDAEKLTDNTFVPRGMTALYDAIGRTVDDLGRIFSVTPEPDRPGKVLVAIITDGQENASHKYDREWIATLIQEQKAKYNWDFIFIGANQDAVLSAQKIGIAANKALTYTVNNARGVMGQTMGAYTSAVRDAGSSATLDMLKFTEEERQQAVSA